MPNVKSLAELCIQVCQRHITELSSVGNGDALQYHHVRDILLRVTNPAQLREIELNSPHIQGETSELWQRLIKKEFPSESHEKNYAPKNPTKWYKIYERYAEERRESQQQAEAELRAKFQGLQQKRDNNVSRIVDQRYLPKPPKTGRTFGLRGRGGKELPGTLSFAAGSRLKTTTGASVMKKARREAAEIAGIRSRLAVPTGMIRAPRINKAPPSMANDHRIASQPIFRPTATSSRPPTSSKTTYISDSSDEDGEGLFGDGASSKKNRNSTSAGPISPASNSRDRVSTSAKPVTPSKTTALRDQNTANRSSPIVSASQPTGLKRGGILGNAPKQNSNIRIERPKPKAELAASATADSSRSHKMIAPQNGPQSPPPLPTSLDEMQPSRSIIGNPDVPKKRKAVDIFMPKKKSRR
ncbi:RNA polymerase ii transcription factor siii subunit [Colletotrichum truncatum]|uniref:RNA polymerase ii transcription factor siii subunit n=1 Tax=Colletotrichum truncatum TaxID=5467 RepID=A0ACC3Z5M3_COLTU|nr:RNA polymerase ii transcription factor siii subunit [Colletotrichum truncatum]KAF6795283.1 RNA polymerase ii transcription factor siii subunit [Colletotrichum truncatum]